MKLDQRTDLVKELKNLVVSGKTEINCPEVANSQFYKEMQNEVGLTIHSTSDCDFKPEELVLIVKIASSSPTKDGYLRRHKFRWVCSGNNKMFGQFNLIAHTCFLL